MTPEDRDTRRFFTPKQARYLFDRAGGKCEACGAGLPPDWHAHHVAPHAQGGRTAVWNGRALCRGCHRRVHGMGATGFEPREWQRQCFDRFREVVLDQGGRRFVLEACPGAGKSAMAAWLASELLNTDQYQDRFGVEHVIVCVPWASIQGVVSGPGGKPEGMCAAFIERGLATRDHFINPKARLQQRPTGFDVSVITYQAASNADVLQAVRQWREQFGEWQYALILDEIHHTRATGGAWGDAVAALESGAAVTVAMSGTYFRTDGHPIQFLDYKDDGRPKTHYAYGYRQALLDRCVRPVAFRFHDATFDLHDADADEVVRRDVRLSNVANREHLSAAQRRVLSADSPCVREMIRDAHEELVRTRRRFPDGGCLIVCQPGGGDAGEDRHVQQVAELVREVTGVNPVVLTHHDGDDVTAEKLSKFRDGAEPYLVAVNMVSEGCDIRRLRSVVFCRYTESEMLFRQIVGRVLRVTPGDDGTAASVHLPTFPRMKAFADNMNGECLEAVRKLGCEACGEYPCVCPCPACGLPSPRCDCGRAAPAPADGPRFVAVDLEPVADGGVIDGDHVEEDFVRVAGELAASLPSFAHINRVQFGKGMQFWAAKHGRPELPPRAAPAGGPVDANEGARKAVQGRVRRAVNRLAKLKHSHGGEVDYGAAWYCEFEVPEGVKYRDAQEAWRGVERWEKAADRLEARYATEARKQRKG